MFVCLFVYGFVFFLLIILRHPQEVSLKIGYSPIRSISSTKCKKNKIFVDPKYLSQIKLDLQKTFREASCWCPTLIKTKNKQIHKQTNKQTNRLTFLDPKYLSQIKLGLHEIFTVYFCGWPKMIKIKIKSISKQTNKQSNKHF